MFVALGRMVGSGWICLVCWASFLGGGMGRESTFPNQRQKGEGFNVTKLPPETVGEMY